MTAFPQIVVEVVLSDVLCECGSVVKRGDNVWLHQRWLDEPTVVLRCWGCTCKELARRRHILLSETEPS